MAGPVLMQHHTHHRAPRPLATMGPTMWCRLDSAMMLQRKPHPVVALGKAVMGEQLLVEVLRRVIPIPGFEQLQHLQCGICPNAVIGHLAKTLVIQSLCPIRFKAILPTLDSAGRNTQYLGRLLLRQLARGSPRINVVELPVTLLIDSYRLLLETG